jgi:hypothetical protein
MASNFDLGNFELNEEITLSDLLMPTQNLIDVKKDDTTCSTKRRFSTPMSNAELNKKILDINTIKKVVIFKNGKTYRLEI